MPTASSFRRQGQKGKRHEGLQSWVACHQLVLAVYRATTQWPSDERFGMISQARRSAYSAPANIAEGAAKRGHKDFARYLNNALGSLAELSYFLMLARDLGYLSPAAWGEMEAMRDHAGRLTWGLYRSLTRPAAPAK
jgi:four helix bundle protein